VVKIILTIGAVLMSWSSHATAQERLAVGHCVADLSELCPGVPPGNNNLRVCMREHIRDVSFPCLVTLATPTFSNSVEALSVEGDSSGLA